MSQLFETFHWKSPTDGAEIFVRIACPTLGAKAIVHAQHGLAEHGGRPCYQALAKPLTDAGYIFAIQDHRGHGKSAALNALGHVTVDNIWHTLTDDAWQLTQYLKHTYQDLPLFWYGHSMGSFITQQTLMKHSDAMSGLILAATNDTRNFKIRLGHLTAKLETLRHGKTGKSHILNALSFADFNRRFKPNRTEFDWLSQDEAAVDGYIQDPLCGFHASNQFWHDFTGGLMALNRTADLKNICKHIPIHILWGEQDPVAAQVQTLIKRYQAHKLNVRYQCYPSARHELLNELPEIKQQVLLDIITAFDSMLLDEPVGS